MINNNIDSLISEIIPKLDQFNDGLLIELLERKRKSYLWNEDNEYKIRHSITEREKNSALYGLRVTLNSIKRNYATYPDWFNKISRILDDNDCDNCKYAVKVGEHMNLNKSSVVCLSCDNKLDSLQNKQIGYNRRLENRIEEIILTDELIELKAIINKLKTKLKNYDAS